MLEEREAVLEASLLNEESELGRSRSMLAVLAAVAPLLGLLGTVTGMIATFQSIALYGTANPSLLSNGISEALITTQLGLVVAVPILLAHAIIHRIADKHRMRLEQRAIQLLALGNGIVK
jgi:biopolymer transport protein ExbB